MEAVAIPNRHATAVDSLGVSEKFKENIMMKLSR